MIKVLLLLLTARVHIGNAGSVGTLDCTPPPGFPVRGNGYIVGIMRERNVSAPLETMFQPLYGDYLSQQTGVPFQIIGLLPSQIHKYVSCGMLDFVWAGPILHACLVLDVDAVSLATEINRILLPNGTFAGSVYGGGALVVRSDSNLHSLNDLKGKLASAASLYFLSGAPNLAYMRGAGYDPFLTFKAMLINRNNVLSIYDVLTGRADVALAMHWELDALAEAGAINKSDFRVLNGVPTPDGLLQIVPPALSEFTFDALPSVPVAVQKQVINALLNLPANHPAAQAAHILGFIPAQPYIQSYEVIVTAGLLPVGASKCLWSTGNILADSAQLASCPKNYEAVPVEEMEQHCIKQGVNCPGPAYIFNFTAAPLIGNYTCICSPCRKMSGQLTSREILIIVLCCVFGGFICLLVIFVALLALHNLRKNAAPWLLSSKDLVLKEELGRGPYSVTYRGIYKPAATAAAPGSEPQSRGGNRQEPQSRGGYQQGMGNADDDRGLSVVIRVVEIAQRKRAASIEGERPGPGQESSMKSDDTLRTRIKTMISRISSTETNKNKVHNAVPAEVQVQSNSADTSYYYPPGGAAPVFLRGGAETPTENGGGKRPRRAMADVFDRTGHATTKSKVLMNKIEEELLTKVTQMDAENAGRLNRTLLAWISSRASFLSSIRSGSFSPFVGIAIVPGRESTKVLLVSEFQKKSLAKFMAASSPDMRESMAIIESTLKSLSNLHSMYLSGPKSAAAAPFKGYGCLSPENILMSENSMDVKLSPIPFVPDAAVILKPPSKMDDLQPCIAPQKPSRAPSNPGMQPGQAQATSAKAAELERYMYKAPELLLGGSPTAASDVYSFATLAFVVLTRHPALPRDIVDADNTAASELSRLIVEEQLRPTYDSAIPRNIFELLKEAWSPNPERRPPIAEMTYRLEKLMASPTVVKAMASDRKNADRKIAQANTANLPAHLVQRVQRNSTIEIEHYPNASIVILKVDGLAELEHSVVLELQTRLFQTLENLCDSMGLFHVETVDSTQFVAIGNIHEVRVDYCARSLAFANASRSAANVLPVNVRQLSLGTISLSGAVASGALATQVIHGRFLVTGEAFAVAQSLVSTLTKMGKKQTILVAPDAHLLTMEQLEGPGKLVNFRKSIGSAPPQSQSGAGGAAVDKKFMGQTVNVRPLANATSQELLFELISTIPLT